MSSISHTGQTEVDPGCRTSMSSIRVPISTRRTEGERAKEKASNQQHAQHNRTRKSEGKGEQPRRRKKKTHPLRASPHPVSPCTLRTRRAAAVSHTPAALRRAWNLRSGPCDTVCAESSLATNSVVCELCVHFSRKRTAARYASNSTLARALRGLLVFLCFRGLRPAFLTRHHRATDRGNARARAQENSHSGTP